MFATVLVALALAAVRGEEQTGVFDFAGEHVGHEHAPHKCIHDEIQKLHEVEVEPQEYSVFSEAARKRQSTVATAPLRVTFDTYNLGVSPKDCKRAGQVVVVNGESITCRAQDILDQNTKNVLLRVLADMKAAVADMFDIVRADSFALAGGRWCFDPTIDLSRYSAAAKVDSMDTMMMVTSWPTAGNTIAWAGACRSDQFGRSIAGHMNYGPGAVGGRPYKMVYATALHELFHALGFSSNRFQRLLNANGQIYNGVARVQLGDAQSGIKQATVIKSPRVLAETRAHYGCPTAAGMEIEDDGGGGSVGSHWEQRVSGPEMESPSIASSAAALGPLVSRITLAYFEDMGVYYPDYTKTTGNFAYGRGQGCGFLQRPTRERAAHYQCPRGSRSNQCNPDGTGFSACQWFNYGMALPKFEQPDLSAPTSGGQQFSDYAVEAASYSSCRGGAIPTDNGQTGGDKSICVQNTVVNKGWSRSVAGAGCFELRCPGAATPITYAPAPPAAVTRTPAPTVPAPSRDAQLRQFEKCETCVGAGGQWCDGGWASPNLDRYGICRDPALACPTWAPTVKKAAAQCYPTCSYSTEYIGSCRGAPYCAAAGGVRVATAQGAKGCENQPSQYINCCITARVRRQRDVDEVDEQAAAVVEEKFDVLPVNSNNDSGVEAEAEAEAAHEKRQAAAHQLKVGTSWVSCPRAGGSVAVGGNFAGNVQCPSLEDACCASKNYCSGNGECYHGHCVCRGAFTGDQCQLRQAQPSGRGVAYNPRSVQNYLVEEDLPAIDPPPKTDEDLGRTDEGLPPGFGDDITLPPLPMTDPSPVPASVPVGIIAGVVVVVVLVIVLVAAVAFYLVRRRNASPTAA